MLKKLGAAVLLVGLCLPYSCDIIPITGVWDDAASIVGLGLPVVIAVAYVAHTFLPPLARFHERHGALLHGVFRAVYFVLIGFYLGDALQDKSDRSDHWSTLITFAVTGALLYWQQGRGTKAQRLPLLLLIIFGIPAINYFVLTVWDGGQVGMWVLTAGYLLAVAAEVQALAPAGRVEHGG